ncbi:hypothetical protein K7432_010289 [Basidiobolus ranarum]|uniref:BTB domain-containing protein n=1 Tax=Basidiobolus ranarum TaxID=34480 RepID=A0ABR2WP07_9FUNG
MVEKLLAASSNEHSIFSVGHSSCNAFDYSTDSKIEDNIFFRTLASDCHLCVTDRLGKVQEFYVEKQRLMDSSQLFQCLFSQKCSISSSVTINDIEKNLTSTCCSNRLTQLRIQIPSVDTFEGILKWIYTKDDNEWLAQIDEENFDATLANIVFLHLGPEAYSVCTQVFTV